MKTSIDKMLTERTTVPTQARTLLPASCLCVGLLSAINVNAALIDQGATVYDTDLNISWLKNANLAATNTFGVSDINPDGSMTWHTAQSWIVGMNAQQYLGHSDWRLSTVTDSAPPGCNFAYSGTDCGYNVNTTTGEMAHLSYDELGNKAYYDTSGAGPQPGWGLVNTGPFTNFQSYGYWSGTEYHGPNSFSAAWTFSFNTGYQGAGSKDDPGFFALAVHPGQVAAVPAPGAAWLFASGLLGLTGMARRKALACHNNHSI
ncbi:MAG: Lcl C-terminal domain-containing protein [Gammaproteobacteria bacterium]